MAASIARNRTDVLHSASDLDPFANLPTLAQAAFRLSAERHELETALETADLPDLWRREIEERLARTRRRERAAVEAWHHEILAGKRC